MNLFKLHSDPEHLTRFADRLKVPIAACAHALEERQRTAELDSVIIKDPKCSVLYAELIINGRWPEAEPSILESPFWAYRYACTVIRGRWLEAEPYIMKDPATWLLYATRFDLAIALADSHT